MPPDGMAMFPAFDCGSPVIRNLEVPCADSPPSTATAATSTPDDLVPVEAPYLKVGRKKLVYYGVGGMIVSLLLIAAYFACGQTFGISPVVLLTAFLTYIFCCAISICVVVWVLLSEMYPTKVRGLAMSIAGLSLWVGTYLIGQLTPWMLSTLAPTGTFLLFAVMCVPYILIVWRLVPETKGLSLEEIEKITK